MSWSFKRNVGANCKYGGLLLRLRLSNLKFSNIFDQRFKATMCGSTGSIETTRMTCCHMHNTPASEQACEQDKAFTTKPTAAYAPVNMAEISSRTESPK
eukprot:2940546-Amphidinium_carterae.2